MSKSVPLPPPGFDDLTVAEQLEYLDALWDRIAARADEVPVPQWHRDLLEQRLVEHRSDPAAARDLEEVLSELDQKLRSRRG